MDLIFLLEFSINVIYFIHVTKLQRVQNIDKIKEGPHKYFGLLFKKQRDCLKYIICTRLQCIY